MNDANNEIPVIKYNITEYNIHIENSYILTKEDRIRQYLINLRDNIECCELDCIVFHRRTIKSLIKEWIAHNVLYKLHIVRSHTKSVDLNVERWYRILCYNIIYFVYKLLNYFVSK